MSNRSNGLIKNDRHHGRSFSSIDTMAICLVLGDPVTDTFVIDITPEMYETKLISHIRGLVYKCNSNSFAGIDEKRIKLWKVTISTSDTSKENKKLEILESLENFRIDIAKNLGGVFLPPGEEIRKHLDKKLASGHIHIIVEPPPSTATTGKRKESFDEENEGQNRKKEKLIELSTPESIVEFLAKQEGVKDDFAKPHGLCENEFNFRRKGREETLHQIYDFIVERYIRIRKAVNDCKSVGGKSFHPVLALQATPGGGKSFLLDELANLKESDFNNYLESKGQPNRKCENEYHSYIKDVVDMLRNSIAICITFNGHSTYNFDRSVDENLERGLVMRILWSYFFDPKKLTWGDFCNKFTAELKSLKINTAVKSILHHIEYLYGSKRSVFLCVDEPLKILSRDNSNQKNQNRINDFLINIYNPYQETLDYKENKGGLIRFNFILTTLDAVYVRETQRFSGRAINWVPLRRLNILESIELFCKLTEKLESNRAYIINKCISDCNGHPRTLEKLYKLLNGSDTALKTNNFATLIEELTKSIGTWFSNISFSVVKYALLGELVDLEKPIRVKDKDLSIKDLISAGIYINSVTEQDNATSVIPTLTLVSLYYFCMKNSEDGDAKTVAKILKDILLLEDYFDFKPYDGKAFESFHMNWELLYRTLHDDGMEINLPEIYGLNQEGVKIKIQRKDIVKLPKDIEFPSNEIRDEKNNIIKDLEKYIFVPLKSNNGGFEMVIFEKKVGGGYIAINIECKFSWPDSKTTLSSSEIRSKYEGTVRKYLNHIKKEPQMMTRTAKKAQKVKLQASNTPVGKLEMTKEDIYLVVVSWRKVGNLDSDIRNNKNIIVVKKENLEKIYSPSLVSRPQFYDEIQKKIRNQTQF